MNTCKTQEEAGGGGGGGGECMIEIFMARQG